MRLSLLLLLLPTALAAFPVPKGKSPSVEGTVWAGTHRWSEGQGETLKLTFREGGTLIYDNGLPLSSYSATWTQEGATVTFTVNQHATFTATLDGDTLEGQGSNRDGNRATMSYRRQDAK